MYADFSTSQSTICGDQSIAAGVPAVLSMPELVLADAASQYRARLEEFVSTGFRECYGARLDNFMPWLLGLCCDGNLAAVAGLRPAAGNTLFIEQYLDVPIEQSLSELAGISTDRSGIIEIGNLAGHRVGVTRTLFPLLTELTCLLGYRWVVCNATSMVQNALRRLGIPIAVLQRADPARLGEARCNWGSYYDHDSTVIAIAPSLAHESLAQRSPALLTASTQALSTIASKMPVA